MHQETYRRVVISILFGAAVAITFLATNEASPEVQKAMVAANLPALVVAVAISGNVHQPSAVALYAAIVIQWAVIFFLGASLLQFIRRRSNEAGNDV